MCIYRKKWCFFGTVNIDKTADYIQLLKMSKLDQHFVSDFWHLVAVAETAPRVASLRDLLGLIKFLYSVLKPLFVMLKEVNQMHTLHIMCDKTTWSERDSFSDIQWTIKKFTNKTFF